MSSTKAALKAAKAALDASKFDVAVAQSEKVLVADPQNYHANVFLGLARDKLGRYDEAAESYNAATRIKGNDTLAWQGLISLFEKQDSRKVDEYRAAAVRLAEIYIGTDDRTRSQTIIDKLLLFTKEHGTRSQYKKALEVLLPTSTVYDFLEGRLPHPSNTYIKLADIVEAEETERINREIGERRTRLGARIEQVRLDVKREVMSQSSLEELYQNVIDWSNEDEVRREFEEKLLKHAYDTLVVLPPEEKTNKRDRVEDLVRGMVILKHPFNLAWDIALEWKDAERVAEWDIGVLREYMTFFPENGLTKMLKGYLECEISPFPVEIPAKDEGDGGEDENNDTAALPPSPEESLLLMAEGLSESPKSVLAHRLMGEYYLFLEEYESAVEVARKARKLVSVEVQKTGQSFQRNIDAITITLATSLIHYESPKNHPEAKSYFENILKRTPTSTPALIGVGLILEEQEDYTGATDFLTRALAGDATNTRIKAEAAWCKALNGDYALGQEELESCLPEIEGTGSQARELKAQTLYRIGICIWNRDSSIASRKDRKGAYARFLAALQANINFAPAYTSLGIYYADYSKDRKRARKCFQKAFELSPGEVLAAERLARAFADQGDWDLVEIVSQRVVDSGKVRPSPRLKKQKGVSWPYAALGVVELNRQEYAKSIISFQTALRISPEDYHSWVGLGESYHNSGRYIAATKAFEQAKKLENTVDQRRAPVESWLANYMLANVKRELGEYVDAIHGYREVLATRPGEFGVLIALAQTLVEGSWHDVETGFFGRAIEGAKDAIRVSLEIAEQSPNAFNLWKAVGDACVIFSWVQVRVGEFPSEDIKTLLEKNITVEEYELFADVDGIGKATLSSYALSNEDPTGLDILAKSLHAGILAHKRAIYASADDTHAQAVAWFNLGHSEYRAHVCLHSHQNTDKSRKPSRYLKAAIRCFKRAIELEAGNSEFWNALGVAASQLNPKVSQHAFVRSLHLNDKNARVWTNLGTLYLLQNDFQLANDSFTRAQSTDPDYAHAWVGQGLLAILLGDPKEAQLLFEHAFEISDSSSVLTKRQYALSTFEQFLSSTPLSSSPRNSNLVQPLFALHQLLKLSPADLPFQHLSALFLERIGNHSAAIETLTTICEKVEQDYEITESPVSLTRFALAKADLGRVELAARDFAAASDDAETALQLSSLGNDDEATTSVPSNELSKCRLSAHLTAGLARYYTHDMDAALKMFQAALEESADAPDVICLLAEVLWAKGGERERSVARDQLFDCIERHPGHLPSILLLGAIAVLDNDFDTLEAVSTDLHDLRVSDSEAVRDSRNREKIQYLLDSVAVLSPGPGNAVDKKYAEMTPLATSILLSPSNASAWSQLAERSGDVYPADMALKMAVRGVPPLGTLQAEDLAKAFAGSGRVGDAQRALMVAPWRSDGWITFQETLVQCRSD
ncbi:MAG: Superkiller protein 3 [Geoglossum umbratile]|nr:MAG: Superkiller protein 3 [Geoglossum umbratile]